VSTRAHIPRKVELAAALLQIPGENGERCIPHDHAKLLTADQIISLFARDHYPVRRVDGGPDEPWNLTWRFVGAHRKKTAEIDVPAIAKGKRIRQREAEHRIALLEKVTGGARLQAEVAREIAECFGPQFRKRSSRKIQNRSFSKGHRPLRSRNDLRRRKP
jgi:hypothetical protein